MIAAAKWCLALTWTLAIAAAQAQTPDLQELQKKLLEFEQSTQKQIQELKAEIAAMQKAQKPSGAVPAPVAGPPPQAVPPPPARVSIPPEVPVVHFPVEYYGTETRDRQTAGENEDGAPRIENEPLNPELLGYFHLPGTSTYMKFGGFVKTDFFYDFNFAGTYYGAYVPSSFPSIAYTAFREFDCIHAADQVHLGDSGGHSE